MKKKNIYGLALLAAFSFSPYSFAADVEIAPQIVNGNDVTSASTYPSYARLVAWIDYNNGSYSYSRYCGATILDDYHILTAAHCVYINSNSTEESMLFTYVYPQLTNESVTNLASSSTPKVRISEVYYPDSYNNSTLYHDVAVLKLESPLTNFSLSGSYAANLPASGDDATTSGGYRETGLTNNFTAVGHGNTSSDVDNTNTLQYATLTYVPNANCNYTAETDYNLCMEGDISFSSSGNENLEASTCNGDSGGPLYWVDGSTQKLVGVTSYGPASICGDPDVSYGATSVFSEVLDFNTWINSATSGAETAKYTFTEAERQNFRDGNYTYKYSAQPVTITSSGSSGGSVPFWALFFVGGLALLRRK
ncbi:serine protease [Vibrio hannami]|uniref:S1 family peptidase n=1 Tax=Vibrio hannami TaxID=2717094 RepID=UPI00240EDDC5|nr:serine protease [Vibrio hannami]MDG3085654.1 serine protease [Vibrio hannami]